MQRHPFTQCTSTKSSHYHSNLTLRSVVHKPINNLNFKTTQERQMDRETHKPAHAQSTEKNKKDLFIPKFKDTSVWRNTVTG